MYSNTTMNNLDLSVLFLNAQEKPWNKLHLKKYFYRFQTNLPVFKVKEASVRRRYSDFDWLKNELERDSKVRGLNYYFKIFKTAR